MNLKLTRFRKPIQNSVIINSRGRNYRWTAAGQVLEVPEDAGYDIMSRFPDIFEKLDAAPAPKAPKADVVADSSDNRVRPSRRGRPKSDKMASAPENKTALDGL